MTKRYILYLEPGVENPISTKLSSFMKESKSIGTNEAQQYHPHCSVTGFFIVDDDSCSAVISRLYSKVDEGIRIGSFSIEFGEIQAVPSKTEMNSAQSVQLGLITNGFKELAEYLRVSIKEFGIDIRPKEVDHISLAYVSNYPPAKKGPLDDISMRFYRDVENTSAETVEYNYANYLLAAKKHFGSFLPNSNIWKLVLYEEKHSYEMHVPHQFTLLREWDMSMVLRKTYPDR